MTHALSSIIDLTNAPTPPRWFEFLLEPGRLQQHLKTEVCDPSPTQLIDLFFRNIPNLDTSGFTNNSHHTSNNSPTSAPSSSTPITNGGLPLSATGTLAGEQSTSNGDRGGKICNGATNGDTNETASNRNGNNGGANNKLGTEITEKLFSDLSDSHDIIIPPHSYEAKYRLRKTYSLQTLAVKVASFLKWDLNTICSELNIPTQYKLMQALVAACSHETCPLEVEKFAKIIYSHWFLKSAMTYRLSTLQPQSNNTTIIYLSPLQQHQQTADQMALMSMGELFSFDSKRLRDCVNELHAYIWEIAMMQKKDNDTHSAKKLKTSTHPFNKAKLSRPKMKCFDSRDERYNDWKQSEVIEQFEFMSAACYDLGRFLFFEENYPLSREILNIIRDSSEKYPLLDKYLQSASDIMTTDDKRIDFQDELYSDNCDILLSEAYARRKQTQDYLFNCMNQYNQEQGIKKDCEDFEMTIDIQDAAKKDVDLRFDQQTRPPTNSSCYLSMQINSKEQYILEFGRGDDFMSRGSFKQALGCFVGALMLITDYFRVFSKAYVEEEPCITRMIQCSISLSCYTQAVALCQMTKLLNYSLAFKQLNERICNDCCDDIYECIWNVTLLEYVINLHAKRGEVERRTKVIQLLGQLELNENNSEDVLREAEHVRRGRFFRIMSNKYL